jgi:hypothetical protein
MQLRSASHVEKAFLLLLVGVFVIIEARAIRRDHFLYDEQESENCAKEAERFEKLLDSENSSVAKLLSHEDENMRSILGNESRDFKRTLSQNQKELATANHAVEAITGGNSYPYVRLGFSSRDMSKVSLLAELHGTNDAGWFSYEVDEVDNCPFTKSVYRAGLAKGATGFFRWMTTLPVMLEPSLAAGAVTRYRVGMDARNGVFLQCINLKLNPSKTGWDFDTFVVQASGVGFATIRSGSMKVGNWSASSLYGRRR